MIVAAAAVVLSATAAQAAEQTVTARAQVLDGSSLKLDGHAIRIWGIAVPSPNRPDGMRATVGLFRLIDGRIVSCHMEGGGSPRIGKCEAGGLDVGALMVDNGYARDCVAQTILQEAKQAGLPGEQAAGRFCAAIEALVHRRGFTGVKVQ